MKILEENHGREEPDCKDPVNNAVVGDRELEDKLLLHFNPDSNIENDADGKHVSVQCHGIEAGQEGNGLKQSVSVEEGNDRRLSICAEIKSEAVVEVSVQPLGTEIEVMPMQVPVVPGATHFNGSKAERDGNARRSLCGSRKFFRVDTWTLKKGSLPSLSCSSPPPVSLAQKVGAEFIGTFILIFAGTSTAILNQKTPGSVTGLGLAASSGLAVMIVILSTGHISGAHLNPSITIAFAALNHFPWKHVPVYVGAQVMASLCAAFALKGIFHPIMGGGVTVPSGGYGQAFVLEFIISFNLMFVLTAVATDTRAVGELAAIAVGATVTLNVLIAGETSGASMNPVRTLGPAIAANNFKAIWVYLTAPTMGVLTGAGAYSAVKLPEEDGNAHDKSSIYSNPLNDVH